MRNRLRKFTDIVFLIIEIVFVLWQLFLAFCGQLGPADALYFVGFVGLNIILYIKHRTEKERTKNKPLD